MFARFLILASVVTGLCLCIEQWKSLPHRMVSMKFSQPHLETFGTNVQNLAYVNVKDAPYNATGDGRSDDTIAFQKALDFVGSVGGGVVFAPTGNYLIAGTLRLPAAVSLKGVASHVHRTWGDPSTNRVSGTTLLAVSGQGNTTGTPFITFTGHDCGIEGLQIYYPKQTPTNPPIPYPYTIQCGDSQHVLTENTFVKNVLLVNSFLGIDLGTFQCPRHWIENVYGQPLKVGIKIDQCYDIGRIDHIHFWPFWTLEKDLITYQNLNAITFEIYRSDWEVINDVFSWGYHIGMLFRASTTGACNGQFSNINFDNVDIGIDVDYTQDWGIMFSNLNLANAGGGNTKIGILGRANNTSAMMSVRGASFWGVWQQHIVWQNSGTLLFSDSFMMSWNGTKPAVQIDAGRVTLTNNFFKDKIGNAVTVNAGADRVIITGNDLAGNTITVAPTVQRIVNANNLP